MRDAVARLPPIGQADRRATSNTAASRSSTSRAACDKVFLMPTASLDLTGMASYELFLRGTLDKIGAYPDALHIGDYKTASNTFTEHTYTPAHREMAESLNSDLYEQLVRGIADGRHKSEAEVQDADRSRPVPARGRAARRAGRRRGLRGRGRRQGEARDRARSSYVDMSDYRQVSAGSLGLESRAADRGDLRVRDDRLGQEQLRLARRAGRRLRHARSSTCARRGPTARSRRSCCASTARADRRSRPT